MAEVYQFQVNNNGTLLIIPSTNSQSEYRVIYIDPSQQAISFQIYEFELDKPLIPQDQITDQFIKIAISKRLVGDSQDKERKLAAIAQIGLETIYDFYRGLVQPETGIVNFSGSDISPEAIKADIIKSDIHILYDSDILFTKINNEPKWLMSQHITTPAPINEEPEKDFIKLTIDSLLTVNAFPKYIAHVLTGALIIDNIINRFKYAPKDASIFEKSLCGGLAEGTEMLVTTIGIGALTKAAMVGMLAAPETGGWSLLAFPMAIYAAKELDKIANASGDLAQNACHAVFQLLERSELSPLSEDERFIDLPSLNYFKKLHEDYQISVLNTNISNYISEGYYLIGTKDFTKAKTIFKKATSLIVKNPSIVKNELISELKAAIHLQKGQEYFIKQNYDQAIIEANETLRLTPNNPNGYILLANILNENLKLSESLTNYRKAATFISDPAFLSSLNEIIHDLEGELHLHSAQKLYETGDNHNALIEINKALQYYPNDADGYALRSDIYGQLNDADKQLADMTRAALLDSKYGAEAAHIRLAIQISQGIDFYDKQRNYTAAIAKANEAILLNANCEQAYFLRAGSYAAMGNLQQALTITGNREGGSSERYKHIESFVVYIQNEIQKRNAYQAQVEAACRQEMYQRQAMANMQDFQMRGQAMLRRSAQQKAIWDHQLQISLSSNLQQMQINQQKYQTQFQEQNKHFYTQLYQQSQAHHKRFYTEYKNKEIQHQKQLQPSFNYNHRTMPSLGRYTLPGKSNHHPATAPSHSIHGDSTNNPSGKQSSRLIPVQKNNPSVSCTLKSSSLNGSHRCEIHCDDGIPPIGVPSRFCGNGKS